MEYSWVYVRESSIIEDEERFSFELFRKKRQRTDGLALHRCRGNNVNKAFDIGIIISSVRDYISTICVSYKNYWRANDPHAPEQPSALQ